MSANRILHDLRVLTRWAGYADLSDRQLLHLFAEQADEDAFAALLERHAAAVRRVCLHLLRQEQDAEDACQATFLVLARQAQRRRWQPSIRLWLVQVAWRTACAARTARARRRLRERCPTPVPAAAAPDEDRRELVRAALADLPEKYRLPLWLCFIEGRSRVEAARSLGCSPEALRGRLYRARNLLRRRLRGLTLGAALAGFHAAAPGITPATVRTVAAAALRLAAGEPVSRIVSPTVAALMKGASMSVTLGKFSLAACSLLLGAMAFLVLARGNAQDPVAQDPPPQRSDRPVPGKEPNREAWLDLMPRIDVDRDRVGPGVWRLKDGTLFGYPAGHGGRLRIPVVPTGDYELRVVWEPKTDDAGAFFILPHGEEMASFDILAAYGSVGLGDLNGVRSDVNETNKKFRVRGGTKYTVTVRIRHDAAQFHMLAKIDDQVIVDWEGKRSEVRHEFFAPPKPASLGLAVANQSSTFHRVELRLLSGKLEPWRPAAKQP